MPRALSLLALLLAVSVAVASASTFSVEYVPSHPQRNHVALCTSVSDECRALPPVTPSGAWGAPNVLDNSWIPARWCRGAKCTQGAPTPSFVTVLKNVAVGAAGLVYDRQNWYADPLVVNAESWEFPATAQDPEITGSVPKAVHVATRFSHNYYHFLTEALPRLMTVRDLLQADPELKVLMNDVPFVRETLALMGLEERLVPVALPGYSDFSFTDAVAVEELIYPSGVSMYSPSLLVIDEIRQALGVRTLPAAQRTKIIYISRANAAERSVENERELISTLRAQFPGEEIVVFTPENMESTIRLFEQAKMIIGAHGAGLTNAIFSAPGTKVVEFLFTSEPITLFWRLSSELKQEYWAVPVPASSWKSSLKVPVVEVIEVMSRALGRTVESSQTCNPGEFLSKATGRCTKCSSGFVAQQDHCSICPAATFANVRGTACVPCPASTNTYLYGSTYEPSYIEGIMASLGASSPSACYSKRTARAMVMATAACPGGYGSYSVNNNNALLTGDNRYIASSVSNPSVSAVSVENLTWFKDVPGNETHTFTITNTSPKYTLFLTSVTLNAVGGHRSASLWNVVSQPATVVPPSTSTTFAIQYAPGSPNPVGTPDQVTVLVTVCNGPSLSFIAQGTTVTIPLIINPDFYTTTWVQGLLVPVTQGVLANDVSLQGQLQVTSTSAVTTTALPTPGASSLGNTGTSQATLVIAPTGNFSLVFAPNFVGYATFTYTAANAYTSGTGVVNVTVNAVSSNIVCPANITINAPLGFNSTPIAWESANASYSAPVTQTAGPQAGSIFSALGGPIQISYSAGALPGVLASNCSFFVTVAIAPPVIVCPSPITVTSPTCTLPVTLPSATASGYYTQVTTSVASPATLPIGQNSITYTATDAVGQTASCSLVVNVALQQARYQFDQLSGYPDQDHDGYGAVGSSCIDGARTPTPGKVLLGPNDLLSVNNLDCDDTNPQTNPGSNEICDGLDNNCNGLIDEGRVCQLFDADLPVEAAPVMLRPAVVDQRSLPSLPPTIVTVVRPFTIPVYTNVASWVQLSAPLLCVMLLVSFLLL